MDRWHTFYSCVARGLIKFIFSAILCKCAMVSASMSIWDVWSLIIVIVNITFLLLIFFCFIYYSDYRVIESGGYSFPFPIESSCVSLYVVFLLRPPWNYQETLAARSWRPRQRNAREREMESKGAARFPSLFFFRFLLGFSFCLAFFRVILMVGDNSARMSLDNDDHEYRFHVSTNFLAINDWNWRIR